MVCLLRAISLTSRLEQVDQAILGGGVVSVVEDTTSNGAGDHGDVVWLRGIVPLNVRCVSIERVGSTFTLVAVQDTSFGQLLVVRVPI